MEMPGLRADPVAFLTLALAALVIPALGEELVFRGLLQPRTINSARGLGLSALSLAVFVLWHPAQVWLNLPSGQAVFMEPGFLALAALLGALCTALAHRSASLWPAVLLHWIMVVGWKAATG